MTVCKNRNHIHKELRRERRDSLVTPRSVRSTLFDMLNMDDTVLNALFQRVQREEQTHKTLGILVWSISSKIALCTALNWTESPVHAITSGFIFTTCASIAHAAQDADNVEAVALMTACEMRIHAVVQKERTFVACIYDRECQNMTMRLFSLDGPTRTRRDTLPLPSLPPPPLLPLGNPAPRPRDEEQDQEQDWDRDHEAE